MGHGDQTLETLVHVSWEAVKTLGGVGTVMENLLASCRYRERFPRTILVSPLFLPKSSEDFDPGDDPQDRLRNEGTLIYSGLRGLDAGGYRDLFHRTEERYNVSVAYGKRLFRAGNAPPYEAEVLLVDLSDNIDFKEYYMETLADFSRRLSSGLGVGVGGMSAKRRSRLYKFVSKLSLNMFGARLGGARLLSAAVKLLYQTKLLKYPHMDDDYLYGMMLAEPAFEAVEALLGGRGGGCLLVAQEYFSLPMAFKAILDGGKRFRTLYYAGEVRPIKNMVEYGDRGVKFGSDTRFYNVMRLARLEGRSMADVFDVRNDRNFEIIRNGFLCEAVAAVGGSVAEELRFIDGRYTKKDIKIIYHGNRLIPVCGVGDKVKSREKVLGFLRRKFKLDVEIIMTRIARPTYARRSTGMSSSAASWTACSLRRGGPPHCSSSAPGTATRSRNRSEA